MVKIIRRRSLIVILVAICLGAFFGCAKVEPVGGTDNSDEIKNSHFAVIPSDYRCSPALTNGDFDGDGDVDFILGVYNPGYNNVCLYKFINDGEGNFSVEKKNE